MAQKRRKVRASRREAAQARVILGKIWNKAFYEKEVIFRFPSDRIGAAKSLHISLADYRKHVRQRRLSMLEEWSRIASVQLILEDDFTVVLRRREAGAVDRITELISLGSDFSEMDLLEDKVNPISKIVESFAIPDI